MSKKVKAVQGPSEFLTHPDPTEPDRLLWHEFDWPWKDPIEVQHPGLSNDVKAEPQRQHERSLNFQPRWFDVGTKRSERPTSPSDGGRDGFGGSIPYSANPKAPPMGPPKDHENWQGVTPQTETPVPASQGIQPVVHPEGQNKMPGFFPWNEPPQMNDEEDLPHPSPSISSEAPPSSFPGPKAHLPGGGGIDRVPMADPDRHKKRSGFLPVEELPDPQRNMFNAAARPLYVQRTGKDFDNSREDFDYDKTGKKAGFVDETLPKEHVTKSARTMEDLMDIDAIFPKDNNIPFSPDTMDMGPHMKHRNERHVPKSPIQGDNDMLQKQHQQLIPNQKLAVAVNPVGQIGDRIVIMSPIFQDTSPAIQALRSQRFEKHGAVVLDGPPEWLMSMDVLLKSMDKNSTHESAAQLLQNIIQLAQRRGLNIEYTQEPRS